jgi:hypothetical protein
MYNTSLPAERRSFWSLLIPGALFPLKITNLTRISAFRKFISGLPYS